jgi:hypothetical protein
MSSSSKVESNSNNAPFHLTDFKMEQLIQWQESMCRLCREKFTALAVVFDRQCLPEILSSKRPSDSHEDIIFDGKSKVTLGQAFAMKFEARQKKMPDLSENKIRNKMFDSSPSSLDNYQYKEYFTTVGQVLALVKNYMSTTVLHFVNGDSEFNKCETNLDLLGWIEALAQKCRISIGNQAQAQEDARESIKSTFMLEEDLEGYVEAMRAGFRTSKSLNDEWKEEEKIMIFLSNINARCCWTGGTSLLAKFLDPDFPRWYNLKDFDSTVIQTKAYITDTCKVFGTTMAKANKQKSVITATNSSTEAPKKVVNFAANKVDQEGELKRLKESNLKLSEKLQSVESDLNNHKKRLRDINSNNDKSNENESDIELDSTKRIREAEKSVDDKSAGKTKKYIKYVCPFAMSNQSCPLGDQCKKSHDKEDIPEFLSLYTKQSLLRDSKGNKK